MSDVMTMQEPKEGTYYAYLDKYGALKVVDAVETAQEYAKLDGKVVEYEGFATLGDLVVVGEDGIKYRVRIEPEYIDPKDGYVSPARAIFFPWNDKSPGSHSLTNASRGFKRQVIGIIKDFGEKGLDISKLSGIGL